MTMDPSINTSNPLLLAVSTSNYVNECWTKTIYAV